MALRSLLVAALVSTLGACTGSPARLADLTGDTLSLAPGRIQAGAQGIVTFALRNLGTADASDVAYDVALVAQDGSRVQLTRRSIPRLGRGQTESQSFPVIVPLSTAPGTYQLSVIIDPEGSVPESVETNNTVTSLTPISVVPRGSDVNLQVSNVSLSVTTALPDDLVTVRYTLRNAGADPVAAGTRSHVYLSTGSQLSPSDRRIGEHAVRAVGPGQSVEISTQVSIPADVDAGNYTVLVVADGPASLAETSEDDNVAGAPLKIETGAIQGVDLVVTALTVTPSSVFRGGGVTVSFTLKNRGNADTGPSFINRIHLATSQTLNPSTDDVLASVPVTRLRAGESMSFETPVVVPASRPTGTYYIAIFADASNIVAETNEDNNIRVDASGLEVTPAAQSDVRAANVTLSGAGATVAAGSTITVNFAIGNNGPDASGSVTAHVLLSTDTAVSAGDRVIGMVNVVNLVSGQIQTFSPQVTLPTDIDNRRYFIGVLVDPEERLQDPNRANNAAFEPTGFTVTGGSGCTDDALEPNDDRSSPRAVQPGSYPGLFLCSGNDDWYAVDVPQGSSIKASIQSTQPGLDLDLELYAPGDTTPTDSSSGLTANEQVSASYVAIGGSWLLRVKGFSGASGAYDLSVAVIPAGGNGVDLVAIDPVATPRSVDPGSDLTVVFDARNVGMVDAPEFDFEIRLVPADATCPNEVSLGTFPTAALPSGQGRTLRQAATVPLGTCNGDYFVRTTVDPGNQVAETFEDNNAATTDARITVGGIGGCVDDNLEPNDNRLQARTIAPGTYNLKSCRGDEDWFAVFLGPGEPLEVTIQFRNADGDLDLLLAREDGETIASSVSFTSDTERVTYTARATERVLIRVLGYFGETSGNPYVMTVTGGSGVDLTVKDLSVAPLAQSPGEDIRVRFTVENLLPLASSATTAEVQLVAGASVRTVATVNVPALGTTTPNGARAVYDLKLPVPNDLALGAYQVRAVVDPEGTVREASEDNNVASVDGFQVVAACMPDAHEPNDGPGEAADATPPDANPLTLVDLRICPGDVDWFRVTVPAGETRNLTARITFTHSFGDLDLYLYRQAGGALTEIARSTGNVDNEEVAASGLAEGSYLLRIVGFLGATNNYGLMVTLAAP
jgi:subtilase family serine protease